MVAKDELTADLVDIDYPPGFHIGSAIPLSETWSSCPFQTSYICRLLWAFALFGGDIFGRWEEYARKPIDFRTGKKRIRIGKKRDFRRQPLHPPPWYPGMDTSVYFENCLHLYQRVLWFNLAMDPELRQKARVSQDRKAIREACIKLLRNGLVAMGVSNAADFDEDHVLAKCRLPNEDMLVADYIGSMSVDSLLAGHLFVWLQVTIQRDTLAVNEENPKATFGKKLLATARFKNAFNRSTGPMVSFLGISARSTLWDELIDYHASSMHLIFAAIETAYRLDDRSSWRPPAAKTLEQDILSGRLVRTLEKHPQRFVYLAKEAQRYLTSDMSNPPGRGAHTRPWACGPLWLIGNRPNAAATGPKLQSAPQELVRSL